MMIFTTIFIAAIIVGLLFMIVRVLPWPFLGYAIMFVAGICCLIDGSVHFRYVGLEVIGLGFLVVWYHFKKKQTAG
jgi:hypothetical protein